MQPSVCPARHTDQLWANITLVSLPYLFPSLRLSTVPAAQKPHGRILHAGGRAGRPRGRTTWAGGSRACVCGRPAQGRVGLPTGASWADCRHGRTGGAGNEADGRPAVYSSDGGIASSRDCVSSSASAVTWLCNFAFFGDLGFSAYYNHTM